ncbi:MAG: helix-turn-helix transcriptional regulator [Saccharospirillaceae bacterium]|jgi:transcriptional regulator with XRE-family HTH domain|nr:helix-turn-helix transcriptional regulator [Saccharospirillaceae bacterium]
MSTESLRQRFGRNTAKFRNLSGITQERLAELVDVSVITISNIERGTQGPRFDLIESIAKSLSIDPSELFTP